VSALSRCLLGCVCDFEGDNASKSYEKIKTDKTSQTSEKSVPVKFFKDLIFPNLRKQVQAAHKAGLKFIKHSDGNLNPILQALASLDGLHSLDLTAGMDMKSVKRLYDDRLVLMGNVSVDNLCTRSVEDMVEQTRCLRTAALGGGYIFTSSNSWYADSKFENCLAMVETGRKYGRYPISA